MLTGQSSWLKTLIRKVGHLPARTGSLLAGRKKDVRKDLPAAKVREAQLSPEVKSALQERRARYARAKEGKLESGRPDWPPAYADPFPELAGAIPEINAADVTADIMGGAVLHHGLLLVRGLLSAQQVADVRAVQDEIKKASLRGEPDTSGWYMPFNGGHDNEQGLRRRAEKTGANWLADSPLGLARVLQCLESAGVIALLSEHFQQRPVLSMQKSVLRAVQPEAAITGWHQDGSFMGDAVRTMNVWVALSPCGGPVPASGLELIPRRYEEILSIDGSLGRETISFSKVGELKNDCPSVNPEFAAGDALIFDEHLLHRTSLEPGLTDIRYALECWLFAPSHANPNYSLFST
jgi:hypothetical protein